MFFNKNKKVEEPISDNHKPFKYEQHIKIIVKGNSILFSVRTNSTNPFDTYFYKKLWTWFYCRESEIYNTKSLKDGLPAFATVRRQDILRIETFYKHID